MYALLRVSDVAGHQIDDRSIGSPGSVAHAEIHCPTVNIAGFEISGRTNRWDAIQ